MFFPMDDGSISLIVALIVCIILSGFFSASETAFSSLNLIRLKSRAENKDKKAQKVLNLAEQYDNLLSTILIGNNIVNIGAATIATLLFTTYVSEEYGAPLSTAVLTIVVLIFGEVTPKSLAKENPETFAGFATPILHVLLIIFTPANKLFSLWKAFLRKSLKHSPESDTITEGELITMVSEAESDGELTDRESELIRSAIEFDDVEVGEVLTHRTEVVAIEDTASMEELGEVFIESGFSRIPIYHENIDKIIGVVHEKDYHIAQREGKTKITSFMQSIPKPTPTSKTQISELLRTFRNTGKHLTVVVDEFGGTQGIITLEDILEELVGEIWDEHDEVSVEFRRQKDGSLLVDGGANINDLLDELNISLDKEFDNVTVGGMMQEELRRLPQAGDKIHLGDYICTVTRTTDRKVQEVHFTLAPKEEEPAHTNSKSSKEKQNSRTKADLHSSKA